MVGRDRLLGEYIPWRDHARRGVVGFLDGSKFAMFRLGGYPWETAGRDTRERLHSNLNETLQQVANTGLILTVLQCRGFADPSIYPQGQFTKPYSEALDMEYRSQLFDRAMWDNALFLGVQLQPRHIGGAFIGSKIAKLRRKMDEPAEARIEQLEHLCGLLKEQLAEYRPTRLGVVARKVPGIIDAECLFSEVAEAVAFATTGLWRPVPLTTGPLVQVLSEELVVGGEMIEVRHAGHSTYLACLGLQHYPYLTFAGIFAQLLASDYRCTLVQTFRPLNQADALAVATRKQNRMRSAGDRALSQTAELDEAANLVASNRMLLGAHGLVLTVFSDTREGLSDIVNAAWSDLARGGAIVTRENKAIEAAWASMIPGNVHLTPRPGVVSSRNFAAMAPLYNFPSGAAKGHWGEPFALFRTTGGTPYRFHLHV